MIRIALNSYRAAFAIDRDVQTARIRAVERTGRVHNFQGIHTGILGFRHRRNNGWETLLRSDDQDPRKVLCL